MVTNNYNVKFYNFIEFNRSGAIIRKISPFKAETIPKIFDCSEFINVELHHRRIEYKIKASHKIKLVCWSYYAVTGRADITRNIAFKWLKND